jgi:hypothetical protein
VALALAAGFLIWIVATRKSSTPSPVTTAATAATTTTVKVVQGPTAKTAASLKSFADSVGHPVYWDGPKPGFTYEFKLESDGSIFIRYLPHGVAVGTPAQNYLEVATYPDSTAYSGLLSVANGHGIHLSGGGIALVDSSYPGSIHIAFPNLAYQVEVYDANPAVSLKAATSGKVKPVN